MNYWIVKGRPSENDFDDWLRPKRRHRWRTSSPPLRWQRGDRLFFWKAAPDLCVVGLGELLHVGRRQPRGTDTWFSVRYLSPSLGHPVGIATLRADAAISKASFLKPGPAGTMFPLKETQAHRLFALIRRQNSFVAEVWPDLSDALPQLTDIDLLDSSAVEGTRRLVEHMRLERDRRLVEAKKRQALATGTLACEVCGFVFEERYGRLGQGFCEVHHRKPLAHGGRTRTRLEDLAIVCSNCHRMLHRAGSHSSAERLRRELRPMPPKTLLPRRVHRLTDR